MPGADLQRLRRWAGEDGDALTAEGRNAVAAAIAAVEDGAVANGDRSAALKWAKNASRRGKTAAERSAGRAVLAALEEVPTPAPAWAEPVEPVDVAEAEPKRERRARPRTFRVTKPTFRRRYLVVLGVVALLALAVVAVEGARSALAPSLDASGPETAYLSKDALAQLAFTVRGGDEVRWKLDGRDVSARSTRNASVQTFNPGTLPDGEHEVEVTRGGGFLGTSSRHSWRFTVDSIPPRLAIAGPVSAKRRAPAIVRGDVEDGARVTVEGRPVRVDGTRFVTRVAAPVPQTVLIEAIDRAGNRSRKPVPVEIVPRRPPVPVRAVHVTFYGWADADLRRGVMDLIDQKRINAIEIDLKDESGVVGFDAPVPLGRRIGAVKKIYDLEDVVQKMHARGIRVIGRLVCFRDPVLAQAAWRRGERARVIQTPGGSLYAGDYGGFSNFANPDVQQYNIDVAVAAARLGVDDVLYDYVRRPDGPLSSMVFPGLRGTPERAVVNFVRKTREALEPYGTYLGLSVFGVAATRPLEVAQDIPKLARESDYIAPMVYPSHWGPGEYNVAAPNSQPYDIVYRSLQDFAKQTKGTGARVVPWLQDFTLGVTYGEAEVRAQIRAAQRNGIGEYILWDPAVTYTSEALDANARTSTRGLAHERKEQPATPTPAPKTTTTATATTTTAEPKPVAGRLPNELGEVPVLMHHEIRPDRVGEYDQTPSEFRAELERLWSQGYWPVRASDLATGRLGKVPAGKTPVVMTYDDSTQYQFSYDARGRIKADTAIGILLAFQKEHSEFPLAGTFYVNREPFAGVARGKAMLRWLVAHGFELGNHTKDHIPFNQLSGPADVQRELLLGNEVIQDAVPGYRVTTMALPLGVEPKPASLATHGSWKGRSYSFRGVMLVGAGPAASPFSTAFDGGAIPRIRSGHLPYRGEADFGAWYWLRELKNNPERRYVSDGKPETVAFPREVEDKLRARFSARARAY